MSLSDLPDDADYDIRPELRMRKILERLTPYWAEFEKNAKYEYDLSYFEWQQANGEWVKERQGYIELEHAESWESDGLPPSWRRNYFSALQRKVHEYDRELGEWTNPKPNADRTVYVKFNKPLTNCVGVPIRVLHNDGRPTKRSDGSYNGSYLAVGWEHNNVCVGLNNTISLMHSELRGDGK